MNYFDINTDLGNTTPPGISFLIRPEGPFLSASKDDELLVDVDGDGQADPGDTVRYAVEISNVGNAAAANVSFADTPDANSQLVVGSVSTSQGTVDTGNTTGDMSVGVNVGALDAGVTVTVGFDVTVNDPVSAGLMAISNQGSVSADDLDDVPTDDPDVAGDADPTETPVDQCDEPDALLGTGPLSAGRSQSFVCTLFNTGPGSASFALGLVDTQTDLEFASKKCGDVAPGGACELSYTHGSAIAREAHCMAGAAGLGPFTGNLRLDDPNHKSLASANFELVVPFPEQCL